MKMDKSTDIFSILIANYNNGQYFKDCWDSIIHQTYQNFEVIIVDDYSTDDSMNIINKIIKDDPRAKLFVNEKNFGCGYTKRRCAALATGDICGFLDPDDTLRNDALNIMVKGHQKYPYASIISSKLYYVDLNLNIIGEYKNATKIPVGHSYLTYGKGAITQFATFKLKDYKKTEGINPQFKRAVDQDLYYKMEEVGKHIYKDDFLYYYRITPNSISVNQNRIKALFWHKKANINAYKRRKESNIPIENLSKKQYYSQLHEWYVMRIKHATQEQLLCKKYYLILESIWSCGKIGLKYKVKCLIFPNFA
jgi:glycosyltransferase involved in cell wall biosynthesis